MVWKPNVTVAAVVERDDHRARADAEVPDISRKSLEEFTTFK